MTVLLIILALTICVMAYYLIKKNGQISDLKEEIATEQNEVSVLKEDIEELHRKERSSASSIGSFKRDNELLKKNSEYLRGELTRTQNELDTCKKSLDKPDVSPTTKDSKPAKGADSPAPKRRKRNSPPKKDK